MAHLSGCPVCAPPYSNKLPPPSIPPATLPHRPAPFTPRLDHYISINERAPITSHSYKIRSDNTSPFIRITFATSYIVHLLLQLRYSLPPTTSAFEPWIIIGITFYLAEQSHHVQDQYLQPPADPLKAYPAKAS